MLSCNSLEFVPAGAKSLQCLKFQLPSKGTTRIHGIIIPSTQDSLEVLEKDVV